MAEKRSALEWRKRAKLSLTGSCTRRSKYGHWLMDGRCIECGITSKQLAAKFPKPRTEAGRKKSFRAGG